MRFLHSPILVLISLLGSITGILFILRPDLAIEVQRRFYAKINWKIEPIDIRKELRNTRIMGLFLVSLCVAALVLVFVRAFP
jgi:hypothetical protein